MNNTQKILISVGTLAGIGVLCYLKRAYDKEISIKEMLIHDKVRVKDSVTKAVEAIEEGVKNGLEYHVDFDNEAPYKIEKPEFIYE